MNLAGQITSIETVRFDAISIGYGGALLIDNATVTLPANHVIRLRAHSGEGKSSLLKVMAGLLEPVSGLYLINDQPVSEMSFEEFLPFRLGIGYGFDHGGLLNNRTIRDNLALSLQYHKRLPPAEIDEMVNANMDTFHLKSAADQRPSAISGSQRKATCVARALIGAPQMVILDDPTTGLGPVALKGLRTILRERMARRELRFVVISSDDQRLFEGLPVCDLEIANRKLTVSGLNAAGAA